MLTLTVGSVYLDQVGRCRAGGERGTPRGARGTADKPTVNQLTLRYIHTVSNRAHIGAPHSLLGTVTHSCTRFFNARINGRSFLLTTIPANKANNEKNINWLNDVHIPLYSL